MKSSARQRLLITGGAGLLGRHIARIAVEEYEVYATYHTSPLQIEGCAFVPLDIRDRQQTSRLFKEINADLVIHTAALVDVDYCQEHENEARAVNTSGTENVALAVKETGAHLTYVSTDSVFDGEKGMYTEEDSTNPLNVYARTKLEGEEAVRYILPDSLIIRTAFYSLGTLGKHSLADWVAEGLKKGESRPMFTNVFFSPIPAGTLALVMLEMGLKKLGGLYHAGGRERCSKYAFGQALARALGLDTGLIQPSTLAEVRLKAPRPRDISLNVHKALGTVALPDLAEGIGQLLKEESLLKK